MKTADEVHTFWFVDHGSDDWFGADPDFDEAVDRIFRETHTAVSRGEAWDWRSSAKGRLSEIIVLDQFSRQLFRGQPQAFAFDALALVLAQEMVAQGLIDELADGEKSFALMPYMHSESLKVHEEAVKLFEALNKPDMLKYEISHLELIKRFGRYPMRNSALGRASTEAELAYIKEREGRMF